MTQDLVFATGLEMVVGMTGQLVQKDPAQLMITVPAVPGLHLLIVPFRALLATQPVVFDLIDGFQQQDPHQGRTGCKSQSDPSPQAEDDDQVDHLDQVEEDHLI